MSVKSVCAALLLALFCIPASQAHEYQAEGLHIAHPWSRAMPPTAPTAAVYFVLHNQGASDDRLLGARTPWAQRAEIHEHQHVDGMMKMQPVDAGVALPAGSEVAFAPGAYHVMLFGLQRQAAVGERFPLTLEFEKAGEVQVEVVVQEDAPAPHKHAEAH